MSKRERPFIEKYWQRIGGTIVFEFPMVRGSATCGKRHLDALILPNRETKIANALDVSLAGEDIIIVQAKDNRLGMYLMGQAVFSVELMRRFNPKSIRSIALCTKDCSVLRPLLDKYPEVEVVII
ncbi:MAG TPA: hypothetical protein VE732_04770 [Nitrososphaera sp.]|nr:hypothetical protein [Nitrososphaera sp.]